MFPLFVFVGCHEFNNALLLLDFLLGHFCLPRFFIFPSHIFFPLSSLFFNLFLLLFFIWLRCFFSFLFLFYSLFNCLFLNWLLKFLDRFLGIFHLLLFLDFTDCGLFVEASAHSSDPIRWVANYRIEELLEPEF